MSKVFINFYTYYLLPITYYFPLQAYFKLGATRSEVLPRWQNLILFIFIFIKQGGNNSHTIKINSINRSTKYSTKTWH